jgi:hypothetical protein
MSVGRSTPAPDRLAERGRADVLTPGELLLVGAIAERVAELLRDEAPRARLADAATVASHLGVSRDYVYTHAEQLGGRRIGHGPRGRLRFDLDAALEGWTHRSTGEDSSDPGPAVSAGKEGRQRRRTRPLATHPLPVRGELLAVPRDRGRR